MHLSSSAPVTCPSDRRRPIAAVRRDEHDTAWLTGRARARASPPIGMRLAIPELPRQVAPSVCAWSEAAIDECGEAVEQALQPELEQVLQIEVIIGSGEAFEDGEAACLHD
jgi:hypothetical protein